MWSWTTSTFSPLSAEYTRMLPRWCVAATVYQVHVDQEGQDILVRGCYLTVENLRSAYRNALDTCSRLLEELLLGLEKPRWLAKLYDNFGDLSPGFRFMAHRDPIKNKAICSALLRHILNTQRLRMRFVLRVEVNNIHFNSSEATKYVDQYNMYLQSLLLVVHVRSGMPARATELENYTICNGCSSARVTYCLGRDVFFHSVYSKARSLTVSNRDVARFLDLEASALIVMDLLLHVYAGQLLTAHRRQGLQHISLCPRRPPATVLCHQEHIMQDVLQARPCVH